jgi:hypothetical protein
MAIDMAVLFPNREIKVDYDGLIELLSSDMWISTLHDCRINNTCFSATHSPKQSYLIAPWRSGITP